MKKSIFSFLMLVLLWSCNSAIKEEPVVEIQETETSTTLNVSAKRSMADAIDIATRAISMLGEDESRSSRIVDPNSIVAVKDAKSRSGEADTLLYVVNFDDNMGYAIVPVEEGEFPLLAITESGHISDLESITNPGLKFYLQTVIDDLERDDDLSSRSAPPLLPDTSRYQLTEMWPEYIDNSYYIGPRIQVNWGQRYPEGTKCTNGISGCGPTAVAQALSYFKYPVGISLHYPNHDVSYVYLHWDSMIDSIQSKDHLYTQYQSSFDDELAYLCREIGYKANANYQTGVTTTYINNLRSAVQNICSSYSFNVSAISSGRPDTKNIIGNGIIIMGGSESADNTGHIWVIDGYHYNDVIIRTWVRPIGQINWTLQNEEIHRYTLSHINWGDLGYDNGYFAYDRFIRSSVNRTYVRDFKYFVIQRN